MERTKSVVTPERFASGMTFDQYVAYVGTPENLKREGSGRPRLDWSAHLRATYEATRLHDAQVAAVKWLTARPNGPAKVLVITEEWSSDCRRDVPMLARFAEAGGMALKIFRRDGQRFSRSQRPSLAEEPDSNADIMAEFLNHKDGQTWQSIPVAVFYTKELQYLYHYTDKFARRGGARATRRLRSGATASSWSSSNRPFSPCGRVPASTRSSARSTGG